MDMSHDIDALRREAKRISRATTITHMQALDVLAVQRGYSHWGALASGGSAEPGRASARNEEPAPDAGAPWLDMRHVLEGMLGGPIGGLDACRHLLVSGVEGAGKTTFIGAFLANVPASRRITALESGRELRLPDGTTSMLTSPAASRTECAETFDAAFATRPDVLVVGDVWNGMAVPVLQAMRNDMGISIVTAISASDADMAPLMLRHRAEEGGWTESLPSDMAVVHIDRDLETGRRVVTVQRADAPARVPSFGLEGRA